MSDERPKVEEYHILYTLGHDLKSIIVTSEGLKEAVDVAAKYLDITEKGLYKLIGAWIFNPKRPKEKVKSIG